VTTAPTLSACLIVRDEQDRLGACLDSVRPFVGEIVVCDTGSVDRTVEVAQRLGAVVVGTPWTDHFSEARNAALGACTGEWVLSVDADEIVHGTPGWLAAMLAVCGDDLDALSVEIDNSSAPDPTPDGRHRALKLFRRARCRWTGRVHEGLAATAGPALRVADLPPRTVRLEHHGYDDPVRARAKGVRNAILAGREFEHLQRTGAPALTLADAALDLGRSLSAAGRPDLASDPLRLALETGAETTRRWAAHFLAGPVPPAGVPSATAPQFTRAL
jgi:hypothetical protein